MKNFLKEAWRFFWDIGFWSLLLAAAWVVVIYRSVNGEDIRIIRVISYTFMCSCFLYWGIKDWKKARAARLKIAQNAGEVQE